MQNVEEREVESYHYNLQKSFLGFMYFAGRL